MEATEEQRKRTGGEQQQQQQQPVVFSASPEKGERGRIANCSGATVRLMSGREPRVCMHLLHWAHVLHRPIPRSDRSDET